MRKTLSLICLLVPALLSPAFAASVSLNPATGEVSAGDLELQLVLDASDVAANCTPRCNKFAGEVVVSFDPALASFVSFTPLDPAVVSVGPDVSANSVTLGFDLALEQQVIGSFIFSIADLPADLPGADLSFSLADAEPQLGTFEYLRPTNQFFTPDFFGSELRVVPLPAAAWLFLTGLLALATRLRRG